MENSIDFFIFSPPRSGSTLLCALISSGTDILALNDTFIFRQYSEHIKYSKKPKHKKIADKIHNKVKKTLKFVSPKIYKKARLSKELVSTPQSYIPDTKHLPHTNHSPQKSEVLSYVESLIERLERPLYIIGQKEKSWKKVYTEKLTPGTVWGKYNQSEKNIKNLMDIIFDLMIPDDYKERKIYGEKTPFHLYYSNWIRKIYNEPKKVILIRHPIPTVSSIWRRSSSKLRDAISQYMSYFHKKYDSLYSSQNTLLVKYEEFIEKPKKELYRIYKFLGSEMNKRDVNVEFKYNFGHGYVGNGIDKSRDEKLRKRLSKKQKKKIEKECEKVISKFYC